MPRVATIGCGMLITIFFMTCIFQNVFSAALGSSHHSRYSIERRSIKENTVGDGSSTTTEDVMVPVSAEKQIREREVPDMSQQEESTTELPLPSIPLNLPFAGRLPQPSTPNVNLFEEYMSRGLYTCTSSYLDALGKLHALIAEVYADYQNCQKLIKTTPKTFSRTDIDALDDMLDEWEKEDQAVAAAGASTAQKTTQGSSQEVVPERSQEDIAVPVSVQNPPPPSQISS